MSRILYTADLHLTANPRDDYRWEVFPWLGKIIKQYEVEALVIAGDLTDAKDHHSAKLVTALATMLRDLGAHLPVYILMGNHDYVDPGTPFFGFLNAIPGLHFIREITTLEVAGRSHLFIPHMRDHSIWSNAGKKSLDISKAYRVVMHQTVKGAIASNGDALEEGPADFLLGQAKRPIIAGDIHNPHWVGNLIYCGSPHPVHFGEEHKPRVLLDTGGRDLTSIKRACVRKRTLILSDPNDLLTADYAEGDMIRVIYKIPRSEFYRWQGIKARTKKIADKAGWKLCAVEIKELVRRDRRESRDVREAKGTGSLEEVLRAFSKIKNLDADFTESGLSFLKGITS